MESNYENTVTIMRSQRAIIAAYEKPESNCSRNYQKLIAVFIRTRMTNMDFNHEETISNMIFTLHLQSKIQIKTNKEEKISFFFLGGGVGRGDDFFSTIIVMCQKSQWEPRNERI